MRGEKIKSIDEQKYLRRVKIQNIILLIILVINTCAIVYHYSDEIRYNLYKHSGYYYEYNRGSTQSIEAFNSIFTSYGGAQTGSHLKRLCEEIIENANTYKNNGSKIVKVNYKVDDNVIMDNRLKETNAKSNIIDIIIYGCYKDRVEYGRQNKELENNNKAFEEYINIVTRIKENLINKHIYFVTFEYRGDGLLDTIIIQEYVRD